MQDESPVDELAWHQIAYPGPAGKLGAFHSILQVTVGGLGGEKATSFALDKGPFAGENGARASDFGRKRLAAACLRSQRQPAARFVGRSRSASSSSERSTSAPTTR